MGKVSSDFWKQFAHKNLLWPYMKGKNPSLILANYFVRDFCSVIAIFKKIKNFIVNYNSDMQEKLSYVHYCRIPYKWI